MQVPAGDQVRRVLQRRPGPWQYNAARVALTPGTRIGSYEIASQIGVGGMGEVYRATDTNLGRAVAIKVLPDAVAQDGERLARFDREARTLAALNHPNLATIHGLERSPSTGAGQAGAIALVMELVEGPTLADRIAQGAIPVDEALGIARQITEALEAAHEQGIIHRDLKPANIKLRPDGAVKVLDFGLAKAMEPTGAMSPGSSMSPTITTPAMTQAGLILGTAAYMSPEQARGKPVDRRADIWAFGCVLYEMLTGARAFEDEDVSMTLSKVLQRDPDLTALPPGVPPRVVRVLELCLRKDARQPPSDIHDVRLALDGAFETAAPAAPVEAVAAVRPPLPMWRRAVPALALLGLGALVAGAAVWTAVTPQTPVAVTRFVDELPVGLNSGVSAFVSVLDVSPDGSQYVYAASDGLYRREVNAGPLAQPLIQLSGAFQITPVFSPDGRSVAYFEGGAAAATAAAGGAGAWKKVAVTGGAPVTLAAGAFPLGASWTDDAFLVYADQVDGIMRLSSNGGTPEVLVEASDGETLVSPQVLPGGGAVLFTTFPSSGNALEGAHVVVQRVASGERRTLVPGGFAARYVSSGHLLYMIGGVLYAQPFDADTLEVVPGPVPVVEGVQQSLAATRTFSVSEQGTLVYVPGPSAAIAGGGAAPLGLVDRDGRAVPLEMPAGPYDHPRVSPDGRWVAYTQAFNDGEDVSVYEIGSGNAPRRLTFGGHRDPIWSADSTRVIFQSAREGDRGLFWQRADGTGPAERLTTAEEGTGHEPDSASRDGRWLSFTVTHGPDVTDEAAVWTLALDTREASPFAADPTHRLSRSVISPDGRWIAYQSNETGQNEIFVQPFPATGAKYLLPYPVDNHFPMWSPDGRQLYYVPGPGQFAAVSVTTESGFAFGNPTPLPVGGALRGGGPNQLRPIDVMPDGQFLGILEGSATGGGDNRHVNVVQHWFTELERLVPTD